MGHDCRNGGPASLYSPTTPGQLNVGRVNQAAYFDGVNAYINITTLSDVFWQSAWTVVWHLRLVFIFIIVTGVSFAV